MRRKCGRKPLRAIHSRVGWIHPIDVKVPKEDHVVLQDILKLRTAGCHHYVRRARGRQIVAIDVGVIQKLYAVDNDALL